MFNPKHPNYERLKKEAAVRTEETEKKRVTRKVPKRAPMQVPERLLSGDEWRAQQLQIKNKQSKQKRGKREVKPALPLDRPVCVQYPPAEPGTVYSKAELKTATTETAYSAALVVPVPDPTIANYKSHLEILYARALTLAVEAFFVLRRDAAENLVENRLDDTIIWRDVCAQFMVLSNISPESLTDSSV